MTLALAIADAGDGSGGSASITGSAGGSANIVYYALFTGDMGTIAWTVGGSRVGDGSIALALPARFYVFQLTSNGAIGPAAYKNFTNSADSIHKRILDTVALRVASTGVLGSSSIFTKWIARAEDIDLSHLPLIAVSPIGNETYKGQLNTKDDVVYPVWVVYVGKQNQDSVANLNTVTMFREKVSKALMKQYLVGVPEVWDCDLLPDMVFDPRKFLQNYLSSTLPFGFTARRSRGLS